MSRKKSPVVSPQPATSVLRRSARLISLQNRDGQGKPAKDLGFCSEPPRKTRRELGAQVSSERLVYSSGGSIEGTSSKKSPGSSDSVDGFPLLRRSLRLSNRAFSDAGKEKPASTPSSRVKSTNVSCSFTLRRSPRFSSGGGGSVDYQSSSNGRKSGNCVLSRCRTKSVSSEKGKCSGDGVRSRDTSRSRPHPKTKQMFRDCEDDEDEEVNVCLSEGKGNGERSRGRSRSRPRPKTKQMFRDCEDDEDEEVNVCLSEGKGNGVRSRGRSRSRPGPKTRQMFRDCDDDKEEEVSVCVNEGKGDGVRSRGRSRSPPRPKSKQMFRDCDEEEEEEEVSLCLSEGKRMRVAKNNEEENAVPKADEGKRVEKEEEGLKAKNERGWTEELELALQGAYLTVNPSPNFWKKVSKMVPGKSAQECFDRVNSDLITPRQPQPRSRARKSNLSPIPQFSLSASKLLKPNSPKTKIRQRRGNLSKKAIRHLLEKQNHMEQGLGSDLFSVLEPGATSNFLSTPTEKGQSLPRILESPMPGSSKDQAKLVSPPVLKQVKNKALHEKYIDHLHMREAKRKAESNRLVGKENIRPMDNQKKDSVKAVKDALFFDVQDAIQKLKSLETENSSSSSGFCYGRGETDEEEEESI